MSSQPADQSPGQQPQPPKQTAPESEATRSPEELQQALGYTFATRQLLQDALTHRSYLNEFGGPGIVSNERLEFLGDAVLALVSADLLYREYPEAPEGELSQLRVALVRASALAEFARQLDLGAYLRFGRSEQTRVGRTRESLLASAFEALLGALYLDGGMPVVWTFLEPRLRAEMARAIAQRRIKDAKSLLQELAQSHLSVTPTYQTVSAEGPAHERTFVVEVVLGSLVAARGSGRSKQQAEQAAAQAALQDQGWAEALHGGGGLPLPDAPPDVPVMPT